MKSRIYFSLLSVLIMTERVSAESEYSLEHLYQLIQKQEQQIRRQQGQIQQLQNKVSEQQKLLTKDEDERQGAEKNKQVIVSLKNGLNIKSAENDLALKMGGRLHLDAAFYDDDISDMGNGVELRRARLFASGKLWKHWRYRSEFDFAASSGVSVRDAWFSYQGFDDWSIKAGQFQEPFSLEGMTSSNNITFMERSLVYVFVPDYHLGLAVTSHGKNWSGNIGIFGEAIHSQDDKVDDGWGVAGRLTWAPMLERRRVLHLGVSGEYREPDTEKQIRYRSRPESGVTNRRLVDTRTIRQVDDSVLLAAETAVVIGPFSIQGEYIHARVSRVSEPTVDFYGWYAYASWFISGDYRRYNAKKGSFKSVKPHHSNGAWELALRYSQLNLSDLDITGGKQDNITVGLNWYLNKNIRFMANYVFVDAHPNRNEKYEDAQIFQVRGQLNF